jgi:osmoprotectant transport system ATP-binding protein
VGADRGLKRLSLRRVGDLKLLHAPAAKEGDEAEAAREAVTAAGYETLLVVDDDGRPRGYIPLDQLGGGVVDAAAMRPLGAVGRLDMPLRDALSIMLSQTGSHLVIVDDDGRVAGYVSADLISEALAKADADARAVEPDEVAT